MSFVVENLACLKKYQIGDLITQSADYEKRKVIEKDTKKILIANVLLSNIDHRSFRNQAKRFYKIDFTKLKHNSLLSFVGYSPFNFKDESKPVFITEYTPLQNLE